MGAVLLAVITLGVMVSYSEPQTTRSTQRIVVGQAIVSGKVASSDALPVTTTPSMPSATPTPTWNTSLLCRHLANLTGPQGSAAPPTLESLEAKCFPGFVCVNGYCTGGMSCKCNEGWAGLFCQDLCPSKCVPEGTCVTSTSNQAICLCNSTSKYVPDVGCVMKGPDDSTTTTEPTSTVDPNLRSKAERECFGSIECIHGYCDIGSMQCLCDPGWKGQLCNEKCDLNCGPHGRCRENSEYTMFCACDTGYTGANCQTNTLSNVSSTAGPSTHASMQDGNANSMWYSGDSPKQDTPSTSTSTSTTSVAPTDSTSTKPTDITTSAPTDSTSTAPRETTSAAANATAASTMTTEAAVKPRTLEDRQCLPNIICQFGYCYRGDGNMFCLCDPGFGGMLCGETCPVDCGRYGSCAMAGGKPFCRCLKGYSGVPCKPSLSGTSKSPDSSVISKPSVKQKPIKNFNLSEIFDPWKEIPGYGPLQSLALRACTPGFICQYGNCSTNPEVLECECQESFTGVFCDTPCLLDCGPHGKCEINKETREEECFCFDVGYTGHNCSEIRPEEQEAAFPWAGVAVALSLLFLTVLVLMLLPYYLWKKRNITMMSFVHWLQPFEEDDGRQYDAFVSYASADLDRQFVIQTLVPRLEGRMCFTLCIHQRNFVPGLYITDNITESVKKSRRTLLIISPAYISSGWCKFEYQMALQEMLTEKHRILPIILGDVSHLADETDETLSAILKSVTWLEYPGKDASEQETERFWKRLELSLPKKRPGQSEPLASQTCLVAPSISSKADLVEPEEKKAPLVLRSFKHQSLPGLPFQQIVRVPANDLESTSSMSETLCIRLGKLLSTSREDDLESQDVTSSQLALDPYYVSPSKMEPPLPDYDSDLKMPLTNNNHVGDGLLLEKSPAGMDIYSAPPSAAIKEFESKDMSALDNYLGDQTLVRQLAV
ncbi:uncharacterized protein LOC106062301 isoform X2 [Biomphalaria glabrata]|uniref:Uncharacterized protein LOC106062301 isoform X2 n=1 Tax=Biomphalaria glabrata TaxID=6526 RepID=A0A9W3AH98_BIOGL|nr:uncharacterized protein LOC106062301 isoform X2 [Biomphalaria glabrata]